MPQKLGLELRSAHMEKKFFSLFSKQMEKVIFSNKEINILIKAQNIVKNHSNIKIIEIRKSSISYTYIRRKNNKKFKCKRFVINEEDTLNAEEPSVERKKDDDDEREEDTLNAEEHDDEREEDTLNAEEHDDEREDDTLNAEEHDDEREEDTLNAEEHDDEREDDTEKHTSTYMNLDTDLNFNTCMNLDTGINIDFINSQIETTSSVFSNNNNTYMNLDTGNITSDVVDLNFMNLDTVHTPEDNTFMNLDVTVYPRNNLPKGKTLSEDQLTTFKEEILNIVNQNLFYLPEKDHQENSFINILYNCLNAEFRVEAQNCILLLNYFRIGSFLNYIKERIYGSIGYRDEKNVITGIIKGSGIAHLYVKEGIFGTNESKNARVFYNKVMRVFRIYSCFPRPLIQICRSTNINANKFIRVGKNDRFDKFVQQIKDEIRNDYYKYNHYEIHDFEKNLINYELITDDIIGRVAYYVQHTSAALVF